MKGLAVASKGVEDVCALEIKELIKAKATVKQGAVIFDIKDYKDLCLLCYKAQSVNRVLLLLDNFKFKKIEDIQEKAKKIDFSEWLKNKKFRVSCEIIENKLSSNEVNSETGAVIDGKVDLDNPDVIIFVYIFKDSCCIGIDFSGMELNKRSYKIFNHPTALRGTIAYSLIRLAGYKEKETLLDCFMGSGTIPIEAALFISDFPINYFNKEKFAFLKLDLGIDDSFFKKNDKEINLKKKISIIGYDASWLYVNSSKKNAKIAGINKLLSLSRLEVEWLDTKFDKGKVDKIVTQPPQLTRNSNPKDIEKVYNEFFYQAEFALSKKGLIAIISKKTEELKKFAQKYKFKVKEEREVCSGKEVLKIIVFSK